MDATSYCMIGESHADMSHEISQTNGIAEIVCGSGKAPWHGLGAVVKGLLTSKDALERAHLDWRVIEQRVNVNGVSLPETEYKAICRSDNLNCLGIVKGRYEPIQNSEAFDFFDSICGQGEAVYDTAGALRGGKQVWLLAKVDGSQTICGDEHRTYALLLTSHDGSFATQINWVTERVVCANTLSIAMRGAQNVLKIRHTANWKDKAEQAVRVLKAGQSYFANVQEALEGLGKHLLTPDQMVEFSKVLVPAKDENEIPKRTQNIRDELNRLFETGAGNKGQSRYDALQAVTDYADHFQTIRGTNSTRLESGLLGSGAELKQRAFDMLTSEDLMQSLMSKSYKPNESATSFGTDFARLIGN